MKRDARAWKVPAIAGALVLALGLGVAAALPLAETELTPPPSNEALEDPVLADTGRQDVGMAVTAATLSWEKGGERSEFDLVSGSFDIDYSRNAILHLEISAPSEGADRAVEVTVPTGMVLVDYPEAADAPNLISRVDADLGKQDFGGYKPQCGTVTYRLTPRASSLTLDLAVAVDTTLWNKLPGTVLSDSLQVRLLDGGSEVGALSARGTVLGKTLNCYVRLGDSRRTVPASEGIDGKFKMQWLRLRTDAYVASVGTYFQRFAVTVSLPYNVTKDVYAKYADYIEFDGAEEECTIDPSVNKATKLSTQVDDEKHTVTFTWDNLWMPHQNWFAPYFYWEEGTGPDEGDKITWLNPAIEYTPVYADQVKPVEDEAADDVSSTPSAVCAQALYWDGASPSSLNWSNTGSTNQNLAQYVATSKASMKCSAATGRSYLVPTAVGSSTEYLGRFLIRNDGYAESAPKTLTFTYAATDKVGVTAQYIPAGSGNQVTVSYKTTQQSDSYRPYKGVLVAAGGTVLFTAEMAGLSEGEYFTEIQAVVGSYPAGYIGYVDGFENGTLTCASTLGVVLQPEKASISNMVKLVMQDTGAETNKNTWNYTLKISGEEMPEDALSLIGVVTALDADGSQLPLLSSPRASAGDTVTLRAVVASGAYTYNNIYTLCIEDPVVYLRLPQGVSPQNVSVDLLTGSKHDRLMFGPAYEYALRGMSAGETKSESLIQGEDYTLEGPVTLADGSRLWTLTNLPALGWYTDDVSQRQLLVSADLAIDPSAASAAVNLCDSVLVTSASMPPYNLGGNYERNVSSGLYGIEAMGSDAIAEADDGAEETSLERYGTLVANQEGTRLSILAAPTGQLRDGSTASGPGGNAAASTGVSSGAAAGSGTAATAGGTAASSIATPPATKISKLKAAKKSFTVKWAKKNKKQVDGYQVRYSLKKNMKSSKTKTVKGAAKASLTVKKLKAGKKYYVQVRTYKKVSGKTYYSAWSAKKTVKVKR